MITGDSHINTPTVRPKQLPEHSPSSLYIVYNAVISYFKLLRKVIVVSSLAKLYVVR